ncbi:MAG: Smr/MutS family protein [Flavobacteriales bacterium]|nr:Smr/MutS family protein [Flavobacteriales bacterium]
MQIGDRVNFVNEKLSGIITRFIDDETVGVSIEDGFEIPVLKQEVIVEASQEVKDPKNIQSPLKDRSQNRTESEIMIVFEARSGNWFGANILNSGEHEVLISISCKKKDRFEALFGGKLESGRAYLFNTLDLGEISNWGTYCFRIVFHEKSSDLPRAPWYLEYTFRSKDFSQPISQGDKRMYTIPLKPYRVEQFVLESKDVGSLIPKENEVHEIHRPSEILDLHINKLTENFGDLDAEEALELQMNVFRNAFEKAQALNYEKLTLIHGVGNGVLKNRIWKVLSGHAAVKTFAEAQKSKFGYGATDVFFKK